MGIKKNCMSDLMDKVTSLLGDNGKEQEEFKKYLVPAIEKVKEKVKEHFDFCVGDLTGDELGEQGDMVCDVIPYLPDTKMGTVAFRVANVPCGTQPQEIAVCLTFNKCGSFGLSFNGGIPVCVATATGVGNVVSPFLQAITSVGFAVNFENNVKEDFNIVNYDSKKGEFEPATVTMKGNLYFTLKMNLTEILFKDSLKIGGKKVSEIFSISGGLNAIVDFGSLFDNIYKYLTDARKGTKENSQSFFSSVLQSKAEFGLKLYAEVSFKLGDLTKNFLPDINLGETRFDMIGTLGEGNAGLKAGFYLQLGLKLKFLSDFYNWFYTKFKDIFKFFGVDLPEINLDVEVGFGLTINSEVIGVSLAGALGDLSGRVSCLYDIKKEKFSCGSAGKALFTIIQDIKNGMKWMVYKAGKFFEQVGDAIEGFFNDVGTFVSDLFTGEGKPIHTCPSNKEKSGLLCYNKCKSGFYGSINYCRMICPKGFRNDGLFCFKPGPIWTLKSCPKNYHKFGCCVCTPDCPEGMNDIGISCFKSKDYQRDWGSPLTCAEDEVLKNALCYKKNKAKKARQSSSSSSKPSSEQSAKNFKKVIGSENPAKKAKKCNELKTDTTCKENGICIWTEDEKSGDKCKIDITRIIKRTKKSGLIKATVETGPTNSKR